MKLIGIDELEELAKSVDPKNIKAFMQHAKIMNDASAKMEDRVRAAENVYAINLAHAKANKGAKPMKDIAQEFMSQQSSQPNEVAPVAAPAQITAPEIKAPQGAIPFHEEFAQHHGGDPMKFKATFDAMNPQQQQMTRDFHAEHLATKVAKSVDSLYSLFSQLKKQL